jgi:hypothetical protein
MQRKNGQNRCRVNNGERPMYYVENNHQAIVTKDIFNRVQEERLKIGIKTPELLNTLKNCIKKQDKLVKYKICKLKNENFKLRIDEIYEVIDGLKYHLIKFDDSVIRQVIDCIKVVSKDKIIIIFVGGYKVTQII